MQDFDEPTEQIIGAAIEFLYAFGVLSGKKAGKIRAIQKLTRRSSVAHPAHVRYGGT
ncbi:MAG: hypothetical protein HY288_19895 [Planctomycetia bacterium]|nr:hypothetical protein [Planctomycetia bacterium]